RGGCRVASADMMPSCGDDGHGGEYQGGDVVRAAAGADRPIDPITFEVVKNALGSMVDEMALIIMRTAHSGVVKDALDYSTSFCDRYGQLIAQGLTISLHL